MHMESYIKIKDQNGETLVQPCYAVPATQLLACFPLRKQNFIAPYIAVLEDLSKICFWVCWNGQNSKDRNNTLQSPGN